VVTGILVVHDGTAWLAECLDALSLQTRRLDRLVIIDTGSTDQSLTLAAKHLRIRQVVGEVAVISAPDQSTFGDAVAYAVDQLTVFDQPTVDSASSQPTTRAEWLWMLHDDSAADPQALAHLLDAVGRSPSVSIAGPKLITWDDPARLLEVGSLVTRAGRRVGGPAPGDRDQGQHDHRYDVLGVSTSGMLIRHDVFATLHGFDPAFRQFGDDLDLCWRAQLAGHRVVVAPKARMREAAASINGQRSPGLSADAARLRARRNGRQVALARCSPYAVPILAIWIAVASLGSAAVLLVAKRPHGAWTALGDITSLMTPWRPMAARWRARGTRQVRSRDLRGLFASPKDGFDGAFDAIHDGAVTAGSVARFPRFVDASFGTRSAMESGPASEDAESLERAGAGAGWRILRHPGFLAVLASALLSAVSWRSLFGALSPSSFGVAGGELLPVSSTASELWHSWLDGWHGAGLGNALEPAPYLPVLSAGAWVLEHLPLIGASTSPVGISIAWLLATAIPASAWTAYLAARVVTLAPWPRAWAALAWASLATLTTAVATGRLGAVVAHILLPPIAAGFVCAVRRSVPGSATFGAAAVLGVAGLFNPALAACGAAAAVGLLVAGRGRTRLRAAVLLVVPIGLLGPWTLRLLDNPLFLSGGPGLTVWRDTTVATVANWQLELLHPGGPGSYPVLLSAPIVLAGVLALSWREAGNRTMTVLAAVTAGGLVLAVASAHVIIGRVPLDLAGAGDPVTMWPGTGLDLAALALIAAALRGFVRVWRGRSLSHLGVRQILVGSVATAAVLGVAASLAMAGWAGVGEVLTPQAPSLPAVAADQALGSRGSRLLDLTRQGDTVGFRLMGAEPGPVARDLPGPVAETDPLLVAAVKTVVGPADATATNAARNALADLGVGFVAFHGALSAPLVSQLDATAGLVRLGSNRGLTLWRVLARESQSLTPPRLRLVDEHRTPVASLPVNGGHGQSDVGVGRLTPGGSSHSRRLVVAEPNGWAAHARVTFAGRPLAPVASAQQPTYAVPPAAGHLRITLAPTHPWWRWAQLGLLLVALFLAAPFGSTRTGRTR